VAITLLAAAARNGKAHPDGLRVGMSWGELEGEARVSRRTLAKALRRLEERGFVRRDTEGREAGRSGAFVLRAGVNQYEKAPPEATGSRGDNPIGLHLRALHEAGRNMWSRPAFTPRRGIVSGTRRVRQGKQQEPRERIVRLGKVRGAIVDALIASGGSCTLAELCAVLRRKRPRDVRRRVLPMLEETGIVAVEGDGITLAADWAERLEDARRLGGELDAAELAEERRKDKSRAYRDYLAGRSKPDAHYVNVGVDGHVEDLRPADEPAEAPAQDAPVSPLAAAVRYYLEHNPRDACERPSWIANTLWALELTEGKPTPAEVRSAIEELGGDPYLRGCLDAAKGAA